MPEYLAPGVYVEEVSFRSKSIDGVSTSTAGFIGAAEGPRLVSGITSVVDFERQVRGAGTVYLSSAVRGFFENGGERCSVSLIPAIDSVECALDALAGEDVSILCCPDQNVFPDAVGAMVKRCERTKDCFCLLQSSQPMVPTAGHEPPVHSAFAAYYHPWLVVSAPGEGGTITVPPAGHVAGVYARTDRERGVWKAPSGAPIKGGSALSETLTSADATVLVDRGIDVLRNEPGRGMLVWAARTTSADPEWKYVNVRRLMMFIERSIERGLQWVVFEPNDVALWALVRRRIEDFLLNVWRSGGLMGQTADEAYFVRCDRTTMTEDDIDNGRLIAVVGVSPLRPAEFVIFRISCILRCAAG